MSAGHPDWRQDSVEIVRYYTGRLASYGTGIQAVDWGSPASQELRFDVLCEVGPLDGASLLDVGCGIGDLFAYLKRRHPTVAYTGVDLVPAMIDAARLRHPSGHWLVRDILADADADRFDYVVASGIFYLRRTAPLDFLDHTVRRMFALCRRAAVFNTLSARAATHDPDEFHADPGEVLARCLAITPRVVLRHDYMSHDFTVYLYKTGA
jgi:SAM-dependent methyltransferase